MEASRISKYKFNGTSRICREKADMLPPLGTTYYVSSAGVKCNIEHIWCIYKIVMLNTNLRTIVTFFVFFGWTLSWNVRIFKFNFDIYNFMLTMPSSMELLHILSFPKVNVVSHTSSHWYKIKKVCHQYST
jgi:hypothetical protein